MKKEAKTTKRGKMIQEPVKRPGTLNIFLIILLLLLLAVLGFLAYLLYQLVPGNPQSIHPETKEPLLNTGNLSYAVKQFYPNMKFNHNEISYKIDPKCSEDETQRMIEAFKELSSRVGVISFYPVSGNSDIEVTCSEYVHSTESKGFFVAGEGGAKEIIPTERYNVITTGIILLYGEPMGTIQCDWPILELHELLHVFGFGHSEDENSLMYAYLESCSQKLDESIIQDLKNLYSEKNLPDLYFDDVVAVKKGSYLDFNVTIKNSGVVDVDSVSLYVFDNKEKLKDFDLSDVRFGGGVSFQVNNLRLKSRSSSNIEIVIDAYNSIKEIDEGNNIARLEFTN